MQHADLFQFPLGTLSRRVHWIPPLDVCKRRRVNVVFKSFCLIIFLLLTF